MEIFGQERLRVKNFQEEAEKERQTGILQGQWQQESPAREYLEQAKCCKGTDCTHRMMKYGLFALKCGKWEEYKNTFRSEVKATEWAFDRIKEAVEKVAKDESRKLSTAQAIVIKSTDNFRRIIAPAGEQGGVTMSYLCPHCNSFPMVDNVRWVSGGKKAYKLVVRDLWRKIRLEATKQALSGADGRKC